MKYPCERQGIPPAKCQGSEEWDEYENRPELVRRGRFLVETLTVCGQCHGQKGGHPSEREEYGPLSGFDDHYRWDFAPDDDNSGGVQAPNLTPHPTGLGEWRPDEVRRAFTRGIRPDHQPGPRILHPVMPYWTYANMTPDDQDAILAYLHQLEPVEHTISEARQPMPEGTGWAKLDELSPEDVDGDGKLDGIGPLSIDEMPPTQLDESDPHYEQARKGKYLTTVGACAFCHTGFTPPDDSWSDSEVLENYDSILKPDQLLGGGRKWTAQSFGRTPQNNEGAFPVHSQNISGDRNQGVGAWTVDELERAIRRGFNREREVICPPMPRGSNGPYGNFSEGQARQIARYLKTSIPPNKSLDTDAHSCNAIEL